MDTNTPDSDDKDIRYFKNLQRIEKEMDTNKNRTVSSNEFILWVKYNFLEDVFFPSVFFMFAIIAWSAISDNYYLFKEHIVLSKNKMSHIKFNTMVYIISAFVITLGPGLQNLI